MGWPDDLPTLDEFIAGAGWGMPRNSYVLFEGFNSLYVRLGPRYVDCRRIERVLDIANVEASHPGSGAFTYLMRLIDAIPSIDGVYVESVMNERFGAHLFRMEWRATGVGVPNYFRKAPSHG